MIDWIPVTSSSWIVAEAYDVVNETIYVRFKSGVEWGYSACPAHIWEQFTASGQSRGKFFHDVLKFKPNARHAN